MIGVLIYRGSASTQWDGERFATLFVAQKRGFAWLRDLIGSQIKAPGFAGGYLPRLLMVNCRLTLGSTDRQLADRQADIDHNSVIRPFVGRERQFAACESGRWKLLIDECPVLGA